MSIYSLSHLLGLMIVLFLQSCAVDDSVNRPLDCCFSFYNRVIPVTAIKKYTKTRMDCPTIGVVFTTKKNIHVCVDAGLRWVQEAIEEIDRRLSESTTNLHGHETESQTRPTPETLRPDPKTGLHRHETESQRQSTPESLRSDPETGLHGYETEDQTQHTPETVRPDPAEPNWFCQN